MACKKGETYLKIEGFVNFVVKCIVQPPTPETHFLPIRKAQRPEKALTHYLATREQNAEKVPGTTSVVQHTVQISCTRQLLRCDCCSGNRPKFRIVSI
jgi:hypothetical protein